MCLCQCNLPAVQRLFMYMWEILGSGDIKHIHLIRGLRESCSPQDTNTHMHMHKHELHTYS